MTCWCGREQVRGICPLHGLAMGTPTAEPEPQVRLALSDALEADVILSTSLAWYNGPSLTLAPGKWLVTFNVVFRNANATAGKYYARVTDGSTHYCGSEGYGPAVANHTVPMSMTTLITVSEQTTIYGTGAAAQGSSGTSMRWQVSTFGGSATILTAVQLA